MKKTNLILAAICTFLVAFTSSCLDSGNSSRYDAYEFMTIEGEYPFYDAYGESGTEYDIQNPTELQVKDTSGQEYKYHRAIVFFKYQDDKTEAKIRKISVVGVNPLTESEVSFKRDTLKLTEDNEIDTSKYQPFVRGNWTSYNRGYLTVNFGFMPDENVKLENFILVVDKVEGNSVNLRLVNTTERGNDGYVTTSIDTPISYKFNLMHLEHDYNEQIDRSKPILVTVSLDVQSEGVKNIGKEPLEIKLNEFGL